MNQESNFTEFTEELAKMFSQYCSDGMWMIGQEGDTPTFTQAELQIKTKELFDKFDILLPTNLYLTTNQIIHVKQIPNEVKHE